MRVLIGAVAAALLDVVIVVRRHLLGLSLRAMGRLMKGKRIRWRYLGALGGVVGGLFLFFEWEFIKHLFIAMGLELVLEHLRGAAIVEAEEVAAEIAE
jgi:hypothetical protein